MRPVGNGERRERELSWRGDRGPPRDLHGRGRGIRTPKFVGRGLGEGPGEPSERQRRERERERASVMRYERGKRDAFTIEKKREITQDAIHCESLVRNAHCCVSARAIVMGPRQPCPSTVWPFALIQRAPAATRWDVASKRADERPDATHISDEIRASMRNRAAPPRASERSKVPHDEIHTRKKSFRAGIAARFAFASGGCVVSGHYLGHGCT